MSQPPLRRSLSRAIAVAFPRPSASPRASQPFAPAAATWRSPLARFSSTAVEGGVGADGTDGERVIFKKLADALSPVKLNVRDVSGGCGAMYAVEVASPKFKGVPLVKQHRMVMDAIDGEIRAAHGVQIKTEVPK
ncbi:bola protein [Zopfochytrium polystomum]|nr:bola protein [Zopfochytrium polystomum]